MSVIDAQIIDSIHDNVTSCSIDCTTYRGVKDDGSEGRTIHILNSNRMIVTLATPYGGKPADVKIGYDISDHKKAVSAAAFRMTKTGYDRAHIKTTKSRFDTAFDAWMACFEGPFSGNQQAKAAFLSLIGAQEPGAEYRKIRKRAEKMEQAEEQVANDNRYAATPGYGMF